uniref:Cellular retinoic acid binding protein 2, a n=1 Tax=Astyanax mexicanus TaxID=7994 RepID=A0A8B9J5G5_ASTMX
PTSSTVRVARAMDRKIPDFSGTWKMKSSENFEELLKALARTRPESEISQQSHDEVCNPHLPSVQSLPRWETDRKISCEQTLQKGEGPKTSWTREMTNDGELILTMTADDVVCTRVYIRE